MSEIVLIVSVDTEEEFDWTTTGAAGNWSMEHVRSLPWFQELCLEYGIRPTYLVDYAIATSEPAVRAFKEILDRGDCEIGAHPHPWLNPPIDEELCPRNTYLANLPLDLQKRKADVLTDAISSAFGIQPTSFKAGRYAIDFRLAPHLRSLGYTVDSSVIAFTDFSSDHDGPNFRTYDNDPFLIEPSGSHSGNSDEPLVEVPCTVGFSRTPFTVWNSLHQHLSQRVYRHLHPIGVLDRLGIMRKVVLSPEWASAAHMIQLMKQVAKRERAVLNVTLHSPSVEAGHTPTVQTESDLERFQTSLRQVLEFAVGELNAQPMTLSEFGEHFKFRQRANR